MRFDGGRVISTIHLDRSELQRRSSEGIGAVTSSALIHGLWLLPVGIPVPVSALPDIKVQRLRTSHGCVREKDGALVRTYSPPGIVQRLTFEGTQPTALIRRAIRSTPIFERHVVVRSTGTAAPDSRTRAEALEWGVGITVVSCDGGATEIVPVRPAALGAPSAYRWWVAELAYQAALQENAQLLS